MNPLSQAFLADVRQLRMKDYAARIVSDEEFARRHERWSFDVPDTKEAYMIRDFFDGHFPSETAARTAVR